ncbi:type II secretion system F family protein [Demequina sp. SYSU T00192]|uniref:Type II secretion system F family protein n=1 Tax=Demequina litoralis TaxID=3051660 RepID=A0ABT8G5U3_9MICO|nr:type II secretion system F family protein [Demequina sp. SYSU T00192]MDN4474497.1 type II secretion system F family protein [Demequina sp. SYSU T00192]
MATATAQVKKYNYEVRDSQGKIQKGSIEAPSEAAVAGRLKEMGLAAVSINEVNTGGLNAEINIPGITDRISLKDIAILSRQLATMISAGLSLLRALSILAEQTENKALAKIVHEVRTDVEAGSSFSQALGKHDTFPPLMVNMVRAGEVGGFLDQVLLSIAENFESEVALRGKVKSAMTYPIVVFVIAILAVTGMLLFIVPVFATMFSDLGGELPFLTQILVYMSDALRIGIIPLVVAIAVGAWLYKKNRYKEGFRERVEPFYLKVPVFGGLTQKIAVARFTRNLASMLRSGVPILQALDIVGEASGNIVIERAAKAVRESVRTGNSLAKPLSEHPVFPPMVVQMMAVGEDTGALDDMLDKIADFYDQEVEATTEALTSLIEPIMIAVLGGIVGFMVIGLYMPIFGVFDLIE